ncbi:MAG: chemotaxis protein CheX, partial [Bacteroidetes bacterium]|nr:chemotaxis protein CheX [Bacteroidota bacterium]
MLNMVCGNALSKIESKVPFELDIPQVIDETKFSDKDMFAIIDTTQSKMAILLQIGE